MGLPVQYQLTLAALGITNTDVRDTQISLHLTNNCLPLDVPELIMTASYHPY